VRPAFSECGVAQGVIAARAGTAELAARAAPALRHAADGQAVGWPAWRAMARTNARHAAQRSFTESA
jgi:hypothetical protein